MTSTSPLYPKANDAIVFALRVERAVPRVFGERAEKMRLVSWEILEVRMLREERVR